MQPRREYLFPPFRLDLQEQCCWEATSRLPLSIKAFDVLACLIGRAGQLVLKQELLKAVWPDTCVGESVLKVRVAELRKALRDESREPRFIATENRRGYRFVGDIQEVVGGADPHTGIIVGRQAELQQVVLSLEHVIAGEFQMLFITGEEGIGKTALLDAFLRRAAADPGIQIARGQCLDHHGAAEPFFPVLVALAEISRQYGRDRFAALLRQYAPSWLAEMPSLMNGAGRETPAAPRMVREFAVLLDALCSEAPVVLVLEDLHWSDNATIDLIAHLGRRRLPGRFLLAGSYRPDELIHRSHPLKSLKPELQIHGHCVELPLAALSESAVADYLFPGFPEDIISTGLARSIHEHTGGNPLFMVNMVDHLLSQGDMATMPEALQQIVEKHLERLTRDELRLLEAAAILGSQFDPCALASAINADAVQVEECCAGLAWRHQFLRANSGCYSFTHALYRRALFQGLTPARRTRLHLQLSVTPSFNITAM